jgi:hypothetical protein
MRVFSPKIVDWRAPSPFATTKPIPSQNDSVFQLGTQCVKRLLLPPAHTNSPGLDRLCVRPDGVPKNRIKKQELCASERCCQRGKVKLYTAEANAAGERSRAPRLLAGVVGTRLFCTLRNMFRGPCCERARAREKKQKGAKNVLLHFRRPVHRPLNSAAFKLLRRYKRVNALCIFP